jgi:hypothetical protein
MTERSEAIVSSGLSIPLQPSWEAHDSSGGLIRALVEPSMMNRMMVSAVLGVDSSSHWASSAAPKSYTCCAGEGPMFYQVSFRR